MREQLAGENDVMNGICKQMSEKQTRAHDTSILTYYNADSYTIWQVKENDSRIILSGYWSAGLRRRMRRRQESNYRRKEKEE